MLNSNEAATQLKSMPEPGEDTPTMPNLGKNNPEGGPHLPTMLDPTNDPERGQKFPTEPDPTRRPGPIDDPSMGDQPVRKIA